MKIELTREELLLLNEAADRLVRSVCGQVARAKDPKSMTKMKQAMKLSDKIAAALDRSIRPESGT